MYEDNGAPTDSSAEVVGSKYACGPRGMVPAGRWSSASTSTRCLARSCSFESGAASALGRRRDWEYEIGEADRGAPGGRPRGAGGRAGVGDGMLAVSSVNPVFLRRDSPRAFVFRVRNLRYPRDVYQLSIDDDKQQIVLRTSNKKYFKRFDIPALKRMGLLLQTSALTYDYDSTNGVLIMRYEKPSSLMQAEMEERAKAVQRAHERKQGLPQRLVTVQRNNLNKCFSFSPVVFCSFEFSLKVPVLYFRFSSNFDSSKQCVNWIIAGNIRELIRMSAKPLSLQFLRFQSISSSYSTVLLHLLLLLLLFLLPFRAA